MATFRWCRPVSETPNPSLEYMYCIVVPSRGVTAYEFYRLNPNGGNSCNMPPPFLRLPHSDFPSMITFVALGSRIYLIGGVHPLRVRDRFSLDIHIVETQNIPTFDVNRIMWKSACSLHTGFKDREAVAIGGKIYIFSVHYNPLPPSSLSRFEVFDPSTETCTLLPEPTFESDYMFPIVSSYFVFQDMLIISTHNRTYLFNTTFPDRGWKRFTIDYNPVPSTVINSTIPSGEVLVLYDTNLSGLARPFLPMEVQVGPRAPMIVQFVAPGEDSVQIGYRRRVHGLPIEFGYVVVPRGGDLIHCFTTSEPNYNTGRLVHIARFNQYSLVCCVHPQLQEEYYFAEIVLSSEYSFPYDGFPHLVASFLIPASA